MKICVSVVMAAFNCANTIEQAIESIWLQNVPDLELIVVDDGSTDNTLDVLARIPHRKVQIVSQENQGPSAARNRGRTLANGEFVAHLDGDDIWLKGKLSSQLKALSDHPSAGVAYGWTDVVDKQLQHVHRDTRAVFQGNVYKHLLRENFILSGSNSMVRRSVLEQVGGFDSSLRAVEDWELHVRLAAVTDFVNVPQVVVNYRKSERSLSGDIQLMEQSFRAARAKIFDAAPPDCRRIERQCTASFYRYLTTRSLQTLHALQHPSEALRFLATAACNDPWRPWRLLRLMNPRGAIRLAAKALWRG